MDNHSVNQERSNNCSHSLFNSGCGCNDASGIVITISPTTGGQFNLEVSKTDSIDHLKKIISKKLKVLRERICLLYRDRQLMNGSLQENDLNNGSRLTLLPIVETGLTTQAPELSVMNALESLNESQVNDFLSGKAPLNLTMRLGDHMMLIQLMLSTFSNQSQIPVVVPKIAAEHAASSTKVAIKNRKDLHSDSTNRSNNEKSSSTVGLSSSAVGSGSPAVGSSSSPRLEKILSCPMETSVSDVPSPLESKADLVSEGSASVDRPTTVSRVPHSAWPRATTSARSSVQGSTCTTNSCTCSSTSCTVSSSSCSSNSVPLAKATRNLTQTLQKLSSEVLTTKKVATVPQKYNGTNNSIMHFRGKPSAILENMEHHGRGIYSGTFSGTLNPALQDRFGRPKKDVSTIIHILNDLLCAQPRPQCKPACNCTSTSPNKMGISSGGHSHPISLVTSDKVVDNCTNVSCNSANLITTNGSCNDLLNKQNENQTTRSKMELLRSKLEERKEKRKEKRLSPYKKRFSSLNLISSTAAESWSAAVDSTSIHGSTSSDPIDAEPSSSIHSNPVIA